MAIALFINDFLQTESTFVTFSKMGYGASIMRRIVEIAFLVLFFCGCQVSINKRLAYEPRSVTLEGIVLHEVAPGPPNYTSIKSGDRPEPFWYIKLIKPIDVVANEDDQLFENALDVMEIQLIVPGKTGDILGNKVRVKGTLFYRHTGHHHRKVLMNVNQLTAID